MATQIIPALNPIDRSKRNAIGFTLPFYNTQPFTSNFTTQQALKNNIINYMMTNKGERCLNPNFGADLRRQVFEAMQLGETTGLTDLISTLLTNQFPQINVINVTSDPDPSQNYVNIQIAYSFQNQVEVLNASI